MQTAPSGRLQKTPPAPAMFRRTKQASFSAVFEGNMGKDTGILQDVSRRIEYGQKENKIPID